MILCARTLTVDHVLHLWEQRIGFHIKSRIFKLSKNCTSSCSFGLFVYVKVPLKVTSTLRCQHIFLWFSLHIYFIPPNFPNSSSPISRVIAFKSSSVWVKQTQFCPFPLCSLFFSGKFKGTDRPYNIGPRVEPLDIPRLGHSSLQLFCIFILISFFKMEFKILSNYQ